jgi:hypothetical protein
MEMPKTQEEIKKLATEVIGDGGKPNLWFVTQSPYCKARDYYEYHSMDDELLPGYNDHDCYTEVFESYEEAVEALEDIELDPELGVGTVCIEDREIGVVREKWLVKKVIICYEEDEQDYSDYYNK